MKTILTAGLSVIIALSFLSCKGWQMDYGKPAAQFHAQDVATKGKSYTGKKITIKGIVRHVDTSNPQTAWVHLEGGIHCNLGGFKAMAESVQPGDAVFVDGFLEHCEEGNITLAPALLRDHRASFAPY